MQTFFNNLKEWNIPYSLSYIIALEFKIMGQYCTEEKVFEMANYYKNFLIALPLTQDQKISLSKDLDNN
ncbi:15222_t:CDS:2 [Cetraspora pellucida]|uniref:15222_t:CDS:1 n=1 Tax=Cetraspora pellucida TaxID=1433469 RepID=A0A9N9EQ63_9GLOM|nr:15222_t:CDS:2 [Cetraspora pellucida]